MTDLHDDAVTPDPAEDAADTGETETRRPERKVVTKARSAAGGQLEDVAGRVRQLGEDAAARNKLLTPTRSLAYKGADGLDHAADYVRTHEVDAMRSDLEKTVRRYPIPSLVVAFIAGYTLRRIF